MYSLVYLIIVAVNALLFFNEIIADLDVKRDAKLSTVNISITFSFKVHAFQGFFNLKDFSFGVFFLVLKFQAK